MALPLSLPLFHEMEERAGRGGLDPVRVSPTSEFGLNPNAEATVEASRCDAPAPYPARKGGLFRHPSCRPLNAGEK